jgi:hypothetical protein
VPLILYLLLDGGKWAASWSGCFTPRMSPRYPVTTILGGPLRQLDASLAPDRITFPGLPDLLPYKL